MPQGGRAVVAFGGQPVGPEQLVVPAQLRLGPLGEVAEVGGMRVPELLLLAGLGEPLGGVGTYGLQQVVADLGVTRGHHQRLVDQ